MKNVIINLVLIMLGLMLMSNPIGAIMLGVGCARLIFQVMGWALSGGSKI